MFPRYGSVCLDSNFFYLFTVKVHTFLSCLYSITFYKKTFNFVFILAVSSMFLGSFSPNAFSCRFLVWFLLTPRISLIKGYLFLPTFEGLFYLNFTTSTPFINKNSCTIFVRSYVLVYLSPMLKRYLKSFFGFNLNF